jgi:hypothetical protein
MNEYQLTLLAVNGAKKGYKKVVDIRYDIHRMVIRK